MRRGLYFLVKLQLFDDLVVFLCCFSWGALLGPFVYICWFSIEFVVFFVFVCGLSWIFVCILFICFHLFFCVFVFCFGGAFFGAFCDFVGLILIL